MASDPAAKLRSDPDLFARIAESALLVAEDLRDAYFESTLSIARATRAIFLSGHGPRSIHKVPPERPSPCAAAFVDGGLSRVDMEIGDPLIVRAGIFRVKEGERDLEARETFEHFPLMLGELRSGKKADSRYGEVVRLIVEQAALLAALEDDRFSDIRILMLHGPLQFVTGVYFEHWFVLDDYATMLGGDERPHVSSTLEGFDGWCTASASTCRRACEGAPAGGRIPAVCMMAYLQQLIFRHCRERGVLLAGVVERSRGRSVTRGIIERFVIERPEMFEHLANMNASRRPGRIPHVDAILDATRYNDSMLLSLVLEPGEALNWQPVETRRRMRDERARLFPDVKDTYVCVAQSRYPIRIEVPSDYGDRELDEILARVCDYASILPGYAFPIGLDIVDKYTAIPQWMTKAYRHLILAQYGRLLAGDYIDMADTQSLKMLIATQGSARRSRRTRPEV